MRLACILLACLVARCVAERELQLFEWGLGTGDIMLPAKDESTTSIQLQTPIRFYGTDYSTVYVNENGLVSFDAPFPYFDAVPLSEMNGVSAIAAFYADVDLNAVAADGQDRGAVFVREMTSGQPMDTASQSIRARFTDAPNFQATSILIVTWDSVGYYEAKADKTNRFQLVIASDGEQSYVGMAYDTLQWAQSEGKAATMSYAQVGFVSKDGQYYTVIGSGKEEVQKLTDLSNVDHPGLFLFRISGANIEDPRALGENEDLPPDGIQDVYGEDEDEEEDMESENRVINDEQNSATNVASTTMCPTDPYADRCPDGCHVLTDDAGCSLCVCAAASPLDSTTITPTTNGSRDEQDDDGDVAFEDGCKNDPNVGECPPGKYCTIDGESGRYMCMPEGGYTCQQQPLMCRNDEECILNGESGQYMCMPKGGYTCQQQPAMCRYDEECILNGESSRYMCMPRGGGTGGTCRELPSMCRSGEECTTSGASGQFKCMPIGGVTCQQRPSICRNDEECILSGNLHEISRYRCMPKVNAGPPSTFASDDDGDAAFEDGCKNDPNVGECPPGKYCTVDGESSMFVCLDVYVEPTSSVPCAVVRCLAGCTVEKDEKGCPSICANCPSPPTAVVLEPPTPSPMPCATVQCQYGCSVGLDEHGCPSRCVDCPPPPVAPFPCPQQAPCPGHCSVGRDEHGCESCQCPPGIVPTTPFPCPQQAPCPGACSIGRDEHGCERCECPASTCGLHETLAECGNHCEERCGDPIVCTYDCRPPACACDSGYARAPNGVCVPKQHCPSSTGPEPTTFSCPPSPICAGHCSIGRDVYGCETCACPPEIDRAQVESGDGAHLVSRHQSCRAAQSGGRQPCHQAASCVDYGDGFCCECRAGHYGNGRECLKEKDPQRINGKFSGTINQLAMAETDLHTYIVTSDGRAYTALSRVPGDQGRPLLLLNTIGGVMGWLFAKVESADAYNGFMLTGGLFNRTVTVHVTSADGRDRHTSTVRQEFGGRDIYHYFKAKVFVSGTLPAVARNTTVTHPEYSEEYTRIAPGVVKSYSTRTVQVGGKSYSLTIDQQIRFNECKHKPFRLSQSTRLTVERSYVVYAEEEQIVRYASANRVGTGRDPDDIAVAAGNESSSCDQGGSTGNEQNCYADPSICPVGTVCTVDGESSLYVCMPEGGYTCQQQPAMCSNHEECILNGESSRYMCMPRGGGTGGTCRELPSMCRSGEECTTSGASGQFKCMPIGGVTCQQRPSICRNDEECILSGNLHEISRYRCMPKGNGGSLVDRGCMENPSICPAGTYCTMDGESGVYACVPETGIGGGGRSDPCASQPCREPHQKCVPQGDTHSCVCDTGYEAGGSDGTCIDIDECTRPNHCSADADCYNHDGGYRCRCQRGFSGDGYRCESEQPRTTPTPDTGGQGSPQGAECGPFYCSAHAECMPSPYAGETYECVCRSGFHGDGVDCRPLPSNVEDDEWIGPICRAHEECNREFGECVYNEAVNHYQCQCRAPYSGDGVRCFLEPPTSCDVQFNCDRNADCVYESRDDGSSAYVCRCKQGFSGDGNNCAPTQAPDRVDCRSLPNCSPQAECLLDHGMQAYVCQCMQGYEGDGYNCKQSGVATIHRCLKTEQCHPNGHCVLREGGPDYVCVCLPGFRGDGLDKCEPADECNPAHADSCGTHSRCDYGQVERAYVCSCLPGFRKEGRNCLPTAGSPGCHRDPRVCHQNAQCVLKHETGEYICICKPGSTGDGRYCTIIEEPSSYCGMCSADANCVLQPDGASRCQCNAGYQGNGQVCTPMTTCLEQRDMCDENADCMPGVSNNYLCYCRRGYHGNGITCELDSELRGDTLFVSQGMAVIRKGIAADVPGKQVAVVSQQVAVGLDFDCEQEKLYWTDVSGHVIRSAELNGSNVVEILKDYLVSPEGIAIDWRSRNVYYSDSMKDEIGVASLDGKYHKTLIKEGLVNPRALAIDLENRHLYYTDWHRERPVIGRVNLDGTERQDFVTGELSLPNGLTVLHQRRELCWVDAGKQRLSCIGLNGQGRRVVYAPLEHPFDLTVHNEERFYWTDWKDKKVHTVSVYGDGHSSFAPSIGSGKVFGIVSVPEHCNSANTECQNQNGGCLYLCLPKHDGGKTCVCPDDVDDLEGCQKEQNDEEKKEEETEVDSGRLLFFRR